MNENILGLDRRIASPVDIRGELGGAALRDLLTELSEDPTAYLDSVAAAHVYMRKAQYSQDNLGSPRNTAYGDKNDPILVQVTYKIERGFDEYVHGRVKAIGDTIAQNAAIKAVEDAEDARNKAEEALREAEAALEEATKRAGKR